MNEAIKAEWIERLRHGNIPQGKHVLGYADGRRCCLGVLCDLAVEAGVATREESLAGKGDKIIRYVGTFNGQENSATEVLPSPVQEWADVAANPMISDDETLGFRNDRGDSFDAIADAIERFL